VDAKKRQHLTDAAGDYLRAHPRAKKPRIDVVEVYVCRRGNLVTLSPKGIKHIENALI
jgi:Holliday junction resolvase-like predicted endonuclease